MSISMLNVITLSKSNNIFLFLHYYDIIMKLGILLLLLKVNNNKIT